MRFLVPLLVVAAACNSGDANNCPQGASTCALTTVTLNLLVAGPGTVTMDATPCSAGTCAQTVPVGSAIVLHAEAATGARFEGWSGDCAGSAADLTVAMDAVKSCTATFATQAELVVGTDGGGAVGGGVSCNEGTCSGFFSEGARVVLRATASAGYRFLRWSGTPECDGETSPEINVMVSGVVRCVAEFRRRVSVTGLVTGATASLTATAPGYPSAVCADNHCEVDSGSMVTLTAPTVAGFFLSGWTGTGCSGAQGAALTVNPLDADLTCTAVYAPGIAVIGSVSGAPAGTQVTAVANPSAGSDCTTQPGACRVPPGTEVTLTAPVVANHRFTGWTGDAGCTGTGALTFSNVQASKTCTANYKVRITVAAAMQAGVTGTATVTPSGGSPTCNGGSTSCVVDSGTSVTITAPAAGGFVFAGWTGTGCVQPAESSTPALATDNPTITANRTCTATYLTVNQARPPTILTAWGSPTGWITGAGVAPQMTFDAVDRVTGTQYQCRSGRTAGTAPAASLLSGQPFAACASPATTPSYAGKGVTNHLNGSYGTEARIKFMSYVSGTSGSSYYAHDSLNGAATCTLPFTELQIFDAARTVLAPKNAFPAGQVTSVARQHVVLGDAKWNQWSVKFVGGTPPAKIYDRPSLRRNFRFAADNKLLMVYRTYEARRPKLLGHPNQCVEKEFLGWRSWKYSGTRRAGSPAKQQFDCIAVVITAEGTGVCVQNVNGVPTVPKNARGVPITSIAGFWKMLDDDRFTKKSTTGACGPDCFYLPD